MTLLLPAVAVAIPRALAAAAVIVAVVAAALPPCEHDTSPTWSADRNSLFCMCRYLLLLTDLLLPLPAALSKVSESTLQALPARIYCLLVVVGIIDMWYRVVGIVW